MCFWYSSEDLTISRETKWQSQIQYVLDTFWYFLPVYAFLEKHHLFIAVPFEVPTWNLARLEVEIPWNLKTILQNVPYKDHNLLPYFLHIVYIYLYYIFTRIYYYNILQLGNVNWLCTPKMYHPSSPHPSCWPCVRSGSLRTPVARSGDGKDGVSSFTEWHVCWRSIALWFKSNKQSET